jgi:DNA replication protein DnaC
MPNLPPWLKFRISPQNPVKPFFTSFCIFSLNSYELKKYTRPALLILDELGFLPIDKTGADLLFQVISLRYEQGAMVITSNRAFKDWSEIFNNDATLTSAILDRLLHHAETVIIEGKSYRMKERIEP